MNSDKTTEQLLATPAVPAPQPTETILAVANPEADDNHATPEHLQL